jgi:hypothetical protein
MGAGSSIIKAVDLTIDQLTVGVVSEYISQLSPQPTYFQYRDIFINNKVDGRRLSEVEDDEMIPFLDSIGITDIVHQKSLMKEIVKVKRSLLPHLYRDLESIDITTNGVILKVFLQLAELIIDKLASSSSSSSSSSCIEDATTAYVCKHIIIPTTRKHQITYCQHVKRLDHNDVGVATVYICHAWSYLFIDVVDALRNHFQDAPDTYIWFDLFCINQHTFKAADHDHTWWGNILQPVIRNIGYTVMILSPWFDIVPLKRTWCLYELYCTIETNSRFEVAMSESNTEVFMKSIATDSGTDSGISVSYQQSH